MKFKTISNLKKRSKKSGTQKEKQTSCSFRRSAQTSA